MDGGWEAELRAADAAAERSRLRWLERQAVEDASLAGVAAGLAGRAARASLVLRSGAVHAGVVTSAGADFLVLDESVFVPLAAVSAVRSDMQAVQPPSSLGFGSALSRLAGERVPVRVSFDGGAASGELLAAGGDVIALERPAAWVSLAAVLTVTVL